jgi:hypothetical protein
MGVFEIDSLASTNAITHLRFEISKVVIALVKDPVRVPNFGHYLFRRLPMSSFRHDF